MRPLSLFVATVPLVTSFRVSAPPAIIRASSHRQQQQQFISLEMSSFDDDGLGGARALLFQDQHNSLEQRTEMERQLLEPNMREMKPPSKKKNKKTRGTAMGFGAGSTKVVKLSKSQEATERLASAVEKDGIVLIPGVLSRETAESLRGCVLDEIEHMREEVRADASKSVSYFYVPAEIHFSTPRGYVLLPFRDTDSIAAGPENVGVIVKAARELLTPGAPLAELFGNVLDGPESELYDFCALRTEPGASRQMVHSDTPYQEIPGLFCAFVALQDVKMPMGGTLFLPGTHKQTAERKAFDNGAHDGSRDEMLRQAKPKYTLLKAGDAAFFDMRALHCGLANLSAEQGGAPRLILAVTFRNLDAKMDLGHRPNLRPGYVSTHTLGSFQKELASDWPFVNAGNGLVGEQ